jgi:hypothetical protein
MTAPTMQRADWNHWERPPAGDEVLVLLSGALELVLEAAAVEERVPLEPTRPSS